ncbi:phage baseplate assembly protein V [Campylobacter jejuni]|nr:phage baseplate assembly protein V [Campylobacter jejuni]EAI5938959.1 phage baseplate assembly protein V [Campylobacter jejuni]EAJ3122139.1 phage baseplate assembly protein V [Campylobacter jejuni]EAK6457754.1 phage baseplate assembly protein V [Campylobacter jejuni]EDK0799587.1 phage baseplate assembly protein V [Campylobacter jejuni]
MNELGIICDIKDNKAKVAIGEMVTDFLSVFQSMTNSYAVSFSPLRVGEQVLVIPVRGDLNSGVILRGLYQEKHKAKNTDINTFNVYFEDGTHLAYNTKTSTLKLDVVKDINITCVDKTTANQNDTLNTQNHTTNANTITLNAPSINLNGNTQIAGAISTSGEGGASGTFSIKGNLNLIGNLQVSGNITDSKGDLTNHTHSCTCGGTAVSR